MSKQVHVPSVSMIALGVFIVAFILLMLFGYWFLAALVFALVLAVGVWIFFLLAGDRSSGPAAARVPEPARPSAPAADTARAASAPAGSHDPAPVSAPAAPLMSPPPRPEPAPASAPEPAEPSAADEVVEEREPTRLDAAREGGADDLKRIKGIGPKLEQQLYGMGFYHLDQIAAWGPGEVAWMDEHLVDFRGRVSRDGWVEQARLLAGGGETDFSRRVDEGDVYE